jgi:hypothetical protein
MRILLRLALFAFLVSLPVACEKKDTTKEAPTAPKKDTKPGAPPAPPAPPPPPK